MSSFKEPAILMLLLLPVCATGQNPPKCPKGYQPFGERCVTQRMADYISCVEASGANHQEMIEEVNQVANKQLAGDAKGSGSGMVAKGSGSVALNGSSEKELAKKIQQKWYSDAMRQCAKVLDGPQKKSSTDGAEKSPQRPAINQTSSGDCSPNILGGGNTVNCGPPPPPSLKLDWEAKSVKSDDPTFEYAVQITVKTNLTMEPTSIGFITDSDTDHVSFCCGAFMNVASGVDPNNHKHAYVHFASPAFTPSASIVVTLSAHQPFSVLDVRKAHLANID